MEKRGYGVIDIKRTMDYHLAASGKLGGQKAQFLIDTGFSLSAVEEKTARRLKPLAKEEREAFIKTGASPTLTFVHLGEFEISGRTFPDDAAMVVRLGGDIPRIRFSFGKGRNAMESEAVLGVPFLVQNRVILDYGQPAGIFVRDKPRTQEEFQSMGESFHNSGFAPVKTHLIRPGLWVVEGKINGSPLVFILDSGAYRTVIDRKFASDAGLRGDASAEVMRGVGGRESQVLNAGLDELTLGDQVFRNASIGIADLSQWSAGSTNQSAPRGLLGADILTSSRAIIDCEGNLVWLLKSAVR